MKLKNLLLGSVTVAGLTASGAYAADLGVLTAMDVCDQLGISGLTISSDTNCLKISGEVSYNFAYGVWGNDSWDEGPLSIAVPAGSVSWGYEGYDQSAADIIKSEVKAKLNFEATADSSFGPAKAVIKLLGDYVGDGVDDYGFEGESLTVDEAYVSIGEGTVLMAGHKSSIFNKGDDEPLNWLGLFNSQAVNTGVMDQISWIDPGTSNAIQITHDLGNGFSISGGLEDLEDDSLLVGVLAYKGENISAHFSIAADDILNDANDSDWIMHTGITATLDTFKVVLAAAADSQDNWNVLGSAQATFDMFTLSGSVEATDDDYTGAGVSLQAEVAEGVKLNVGGRWADYAGETSYEVAVGAEATVAENLTLSGAIGYVDDGDGGAHGTATFAYGWAKLAWAPGGGFTASLKGTVTNPMDYTTTDVYGPGYKIETEFKKTFE